MNMKKYKFLLKPLFFIFNLLFATWLVLKIEKIKPSDFGKHKSIFYSEPKPRIVSLDDKEYIKQLFEDYKRGELDSLKLEEHINAFLSPVSKK
jgi:hypothetical protein